MESIVQTALTNGEKCHLTIDAGLVRDWVKTKRVLALVQCSEEFALFMYSVKNCPPEKSTDLVLEGILPVNAEFKCEIDLVEGWVKDVYLKLSTRKAKFLFEMPFGPKTNSFTTEISKAVEIYSRQTAGSDFSWLQKYENLLSTSPCKSEIVTEEMSQLQIRRAAMEQDEDDISRSSELESPDSFQHLPREKIAIGATPLAARDSVVRLQMTMREDDYTNVHSFTVFVGTWNVNGQAPNESLTKWLTADADPPDIYAIGFQELDLSKEAFLFSDSPREQEWFLSVRSALHPKAKYRKVKLVRLVGMMLIVFVQTKHISAIANVVAETVGTGIMGKMGNKGGVAIRFDLHNTSLCFVNSHLAAHMDECERRNQDFHDICARMAFTQFSPPKSIKNHDQIFWLGDLNYRIASLDAEVVKSFVEGGDYERLLEYDQLKQQHSLKKVFVGYTEGSVTFEPTYKYDPGTDKWDTSDKCRAPAWCDRILWKGNNISQKAYRIHRALKVSDHKPVSSLFESGIKIIDVSKYRKIYEEVMKKLDKLENEFLPQVTVDNTEVVFSNLRFLESQARYLTIANTGQVPVQFEFIKKLNDTSYCKEWLKIKPYTSFIMPGEKCDIEIEVYIDKYSAEKLNMAEDKIYDILVLHLEGGKDIFITVSGTYKRTCFGLDLERLVQMHRPIRDAPVENLLDLDSTTDNHCPLMDEPYDIPKEIWLLVDHLYKFALYQERLFEQPGLHSEIQQICEWLDTGVPVKIPGSVYSVAETLLVFLESLPEPVIPYSFYSKCLENSNNFVACKRILSQIPRVHHNVFKYLTCFLRELLLHSEKNKLDSKMLTAIFGSSMIRAPRISSDANARMASSQVVDRKKATFVYHFLINEYDG